MTRYSQRLVTGLVVLTWLVMTAQACVFVARYGQNLPRQDEWEFVPALYGHEASVPWIFARHYEHRYPLARAVYLTLHTVTGQNFRAGMWISLLLLVVSAGVLLLAARKTRGQCDLFDLFIPVLLLNAGHVENFTMGYQIAFTLTIAWLTVFLVAVVWSERIGLRRVALLCGVATMCVALGGGIGWVFAPLLGLFTIGRAVAAARLSPRRIGNAILLMAMPVLACVYVAASVVELKLSGTSYPNNNLRTALGVAFDFWTVSLGGAGQVGYPLPGIVALICIVESLVFVAVMLATRPAERVRVSGCAAMLVGIVMISIVIGITRPLGNESRYAIFGGFGLCIIILMHAMTSTARSLASPGLLLIPIIAGLIAWQDWQVGTQFSQVYANRTAMLHRDVRLGLPINAIGERHVIFPIAIYQQNFELLYSSGHKSLRGAGQARPLRAVPIALPPDARLPAYDGNGPAPAFELTLPMPMQMEMLRLEFDSPDARYREIYQLELPNNPDDSAGIASLWVVTGRRTMLFRVEGVLDRIIIRPVERTPGQKLLKCEAILFN